jgi:aminoglycoside phosphotransferase (APT) family kinase protein
VGHVDPSDPRAVGAAVARWLSDRLGVDVGLAEPPARAGEGYDTTIHLVRFAGDQVPGEWSRPLVVRIHPSAERWDHARREADIQGFCADRGYPCPRVLATVAPGELLDLPVQILERAPGVTMAAALSRQPWQFGRHVALLGTLHARLHALPVDGFPAADSGPADQARRRLHLVRQVIDADVAADGLADALGRVEALVPRLADGGGRLSVCHGDFHPLNVLVDGRGAQVIDWTDAGLGDAHGDVARLLTLLRALPAGAPGRAGKVLMRVVAPRLSLGYLRAYARAAGADGSPPLDEARLRLWEPVQLAHDWARAAVEARAAGAAGADAGPGRRSIDPGVVDWIRRRFDQAMAAL